MADYRIELGIGLDKGDLNQIKNQINNIQQQKKIDLEFNKKKIDNQLDSVRKQIQNLSNIKIDIGGNGTGKGNILNISTSDISNIVNSFGKAESAINSIHKAIGTLDDGSDMKPLLKSINDINSALTQTVGKFKSLTDAIGGAKFDINLKLGGNPASTNARYGAEANQVIKQLQLRAEAIGRAIADANGSKKSWDAEIASAISGGVGGQAALESWWNRNNPDLKKLNKMDLYRDVNNRLDAYVASRSDIDISAIAAQYSKSADDMYADTVKLITGEKQLEEQTEKLKQVFGSGIDSAALESIVSDLNEINASIKTLASDTSLGGLTQSFKSLADTLENITRNITTFQQAINTATTGGSNIGSNITNEVKDVVNTLETTASQGGKSFGENFTDSAKSAFNLDDVIDAEADKIVKEFGLKGKQAKEQIKAALSDYRTKKIQDDINYESGKDFVPTARVSDVADIIVDNIKKVESDIYKDVYEYAKDSKTSKITEYTDANGNVVKKRSYSYNTSPVYIPESVIKDLGEEEWKQVQKNLGSRKFTTKQSAGTITLDDFFKGINENCNNALKYSGQIEDDFRDFYGKFMLGKKGSLDEFDNSIFRRDQTGESETDKNLSEHGLSKESYDGIVSSVDSAVDRINTLEQASKQLGDTTSQSQQKASDAYQETLNKLEEVNRKVAEYDAKIKEINTRSESLGELGASDDQIEEAKRVETEDYKNQFKEKYGIDIDSLRQQKAELLAVAQAANQTGNALDSAFEGAESEAKETTGVIENLKSTLQSMRVDRSSIDAIIKDVEELGFTAKDASVAMKNGNLDITVTGIDSIGRVITEVRHLDDVVEELPGVSRKISQSLSETDNFVKQQKRNVTDLTNQINELNRKAIDPNTSKPIKDESHLNSLKDKYNEVVAAIKKMGDASSSTFDEERNAVKTLISEYKSLTREYKNAETVATSLRSKDINTVKATYTSKLDVLISKMKDSGVYSAGFEKGAENLRSILSSSVDAKGLVSFLNGLDKLDAGYKRAAQSAKSFAQADTYGKRASGLESEIKNIQRISPEVNEFETEINGAKVSVQSLLKDLSQVKTKADFNSVNEDIKAFKKAAEASGIAIRETAKSVKSIDDAAKEIKIKIDNRSFNDELSKVKTGINQLSEPSRDLIESFAKVKRAYQDMISASKNKDWGALISANERYEQSLDSLSNQLKIAARIEKEFTSEQKQSFNNLKSAADKMNVLRTELAHLDEKTNANEFASVKKRFEEAESSYNSLKQELQGKISTEQWDIIQSEIKETDNYISQLKARLKDLDARKSAKLQENSIKKIKEKMSRSDTGVLDSNYDKQIANIENSFGKLTIQSNELRGRIESLKTILAQMYKTDDAEKLISLNGQLEQSFKNVGNAVANAAKSQEEAAAKKAATVKKQTDTSAEKIKLDIDNKSFDDEISKAETSLRSLSGQSKELKKSLEIVKTAFNEMKLAKESGDNDALVAANKRYEQSLESLNNQLKIAARVEKEFTAEQKQSFKDLKSAADNMVSLKKELSGLDENINANEFANVSAKFKQAEADYLSLKKALQGKISAEQWGTIQAEIDETDAELAQLAARYNDVKAALGQKIKLNVSDTGEFTEEVNKLEVRFNNLSQKTTESVESIKKLKQALEDMRNASNDDERIKAEKRYQEVLQDTKVFIDRNEDSIRQINDANLFELNKTKELQRLDDIFDKGSAAARKFGQELEELRAELKAVGNSDDLQQLHKKVDIFATKVGKSGLNTKTLFSGIKTQFQKYSTYFGVAEMIMYAEQGLRDMFEQVRLIDSAMTELKKVTNETDATYDAFLSNAGERAKAIGTTIDGLVESTASFARLGYGFEDAQGLAEVANIYAVVGDEVEGVEGATTSLISTMTAFKNEMNGLSNSDFAMGIVDKINEVSNNFAITSGGLGEALQRSASSMSVAGNSLDETISLITAANTVVQNPEKVGRFLPT